MAMDNPLNPLNPQDTEKQGDSHSSDADASTSAHAPSDQEGAKQDPATAHENNDTHKSGDDSLAAQDHEGPSGTAHDEEHDHDDNVGHDAGHDASHESGHEGEHSLQDHYLGQSHLLGHVADTDHFHIPGGMGEENIIKVYIPRLSPWSEEKPLIAAPKGAEQFVGATTFQPTKFIVLELFAAILVATVFIWLGRKMKDGAAPKGKIWNMLEAGVIYIRDEVAKPAIGSHDFKYFLPLLLTIFFFILTMNLMGMFPLLGTPTGNISIAISLALVVFAVVMFSGMKKLGVAGFWKAQAPHIDLHPAMRIPVTFGIWLIEVFGLFVKHMVLAVRLFANMFAGHVVLAVFVGFIGVTWGTALAIGVIPASIGASIAIGLLELLVAFIQAYVFTFLTALFIGSALHPH